MPVRSFRCPNPYLQWGSNKKLHYQASTQGAATRKSEDRIKQRALSSRRSYLSLLFSPKQLCPLRNSARAIYYAYIGRRERWVSQFLQDLYLWTIGRSQSDFLLKHAFQTMWSASQWESSGKTGSSRQSTEAGIVFSSEKIRWLTTSWLNVQVNSRRSANLSND